MAFDLLNSFSNYQSKISTDILQGDSGKLQAAELQKLMQEIRGLTSGATLSGELVEIRGNEIKLMLQNSLLLNAKMDGELSLTKGEMMTFQVNGNKNGQLSLRPLFANTGQEVNAMKALDAANLPINGKTLQMVNELMKFGMSVNKEQLTEIYRQVQSYSDAEVADLVLLHKMGIEVNESSLEQLKLYQNNNQQLLPQLSSMSKEMTGFLEQVLQEASPDQTQQIISRFMEIFTKQTGQPELFGKTDTLPITAEQGNITDETGNLQPDTGKEQIPSDTESTSLKQTLLQELETLLRPSTGEKGKVSGEKLQDTMQNLLRQEFLMEPDKVSENEYVKKYYEKLSDQLQKLESLIKETGKNESTFSKSVTLVKENVSFMNQINELYHYVQLPLKMNEQGASGDLYVYKRKQAKTDEDGNLTALLHLSMKTLGNMDIFLSLKEGKLSTRFCMEKEELIDFMEEHMELLNSRLQKKGYEVTAVVTGKQQTDENIITNIMREDGTVTVYSKQSFDARA